ncbi:MAG: hypothetical protein NUV32_10675 [Exilispira sp.]|jgi:glycerol-3-phosphate acyltransferase PlsY|nr:hypothetical protein [Exilispira sp.]
MSIKDKDIPISVLVLIYTLEQIFFTIFFIFIFAGAKIHQFVKIEFVKELYLKFGIFFLQYYYLWNIRYRNTTFLFSLLGYKINYNKRENIPLH